MNSPSHFLIGSFLYKFLKEEYGIVLEEESFLRGNVLPDYSPLAVMHPHFCWFSLRYIQRETEILADEELRSATVGKEYSRRLGILCHYYADFFCYSHSRRFKQRVVNHLQYEELLYQFLVSRPEVLQSPRVLPAGWRDAGELSDRISGLLDEYGDASPHFERDIAYTLRVCTELIVALYELSCRRRDNCGGEVYEACGASAG
jgi:hypothetical protein